MSRSEAVVIESIEVREHLRCLFYLDILNKLLLLQCKHSKYMYARCLNFPCFITKFSCMHAYILNVLTQRLTRGFKKVRNWGFWFFLVKNVFFQKNTKFSKRKWENQKTRRRMQLKLY